MEEKTSTIPFKLKDNLIDKENILFYLVIITVLLLRTTLLGRGLTSFTDEYRYFNTLDAVKQFSQGHFTQGIVALNATQGRPGDAVVRLLPAIIQAAIFKVFHINTNTPTSLVTAAWMNWCVLVINIVLFYKIAKVFFNDKWSKVSVIIYVCLVNTNIYLRHILPYDIALCVFLLAFLLAIKAYKAKLSNERMSAFKIGVLAGITFVIYPGYFLAPVILALLMMELPIVAGSLQRLLVRGAVYIIGFVGVILVFEAISRIGGESYLMKGSTLSSTVTQGDFSEGFSFAATYLINVERGLGYMLLALLLWSLRSLVWSPRLDSTGGITFREQRIRLALALALPWLCYASLAFFGHKLVFYGRILHLFIPVLILVCICGIAHIKHSSLRYFLIAASAVSFLTFFVDYRKVVYAKDLAFENKICAPLPILVKRYDTACGDDDYIYEPFQTKYTEAPNSVAAASTDTLVLVNFGFLYPIRCHQPLGDMRNRGTLVAQGDWMGKFPAYQYEGYSPRERRLLNAHDYQFQIYTTSDNSQKSSTIE